MNAFRVPIEGLHTETGPGVFEAAILYSDPLEAADRAVLFKTGAIGNPHRSSPEKGKLMCEAKAARLAELLDAIYRSPKREFRLAPKES